MFRARECHHEDVRAIPFSHKLAATDTNAHFASPADLTAAKIRFDTGWSNPAADFRWLMGFRSRLVLDAVPAANGEPLSMSLAPYTFVTGSVRQQRLMLLIDGSPVTADALDTKISLSVPIPKDIGDSFVLDFLHPDAHQPAASIVSSADRRSLGFALKSVIFSTGRPGA